MLLLRQYVWLSGLCLADADDLIPALVVAGGLEGAGEEAPVPGIDIAPRLHHIAGIGGLDLLLLPRRQLIRLLIDGFPRDDVHRLADHLT